MGVAVVVLLTALAADRAGAQDSLQIRGVVRTGDATEVVVSMPAGTDIPSGATATLVVDGTALPATARPLAGPDAAVLLVVDTSGPPDLFRPLQGALVDAARRLPPGWRAVLANSTTGEARDHGTDRDALVADVAGLTPGPGSDLSAALTAGRAALPEAGPVGTVLVAGNAARVPAEVEATVDRPVWIVGLSGSGASDAAARVAQRSGTDPTVVADGAGVLPAVTGATVDLASRYVVATDQPVQGKRLTVQLTTTTGTLTGSADLAQVPGGDVAATTTTAAPATPPTTVASEAGAADAGDDAALPGWLLPAVGAALVVALVGLLVLLRRRRGATAPADDAATSAPLPPAPVATGAAPTAPTPPATAPGAPFAPAPAPAPAPAMTAPPVGAPAPVFSAVGPAAPPPAAPTPPPVTPGPSRPGTRTPLFGAGAPLHHGAVEAVGPDAPGPTRVFDTRPRSDNGGARPAERPEMLLPPMATTPPPVSTPLPDGPTIDLRRTPAIGDAALTVAGQVAEAAVEELAAARRAAGAAVPVELLFALEAAGSTWLDRPSTSPADLLALLDPTGSPDEAVAARLAALHRCATLPASTGGRDAADRAVELLTAPSPDHVDDRGPSTVPTGHTPSLLALATEAAVVERAERYGTLAPTAARTLLATGPARTGHLDGTPVVVSPSLVPADDGPVTGEALGERSLTLALALADAATRMAGAELSHRQAAARVATLVRGTMTRDAAKRVTELLVSRPLLTPAILAEHLAGVPGGADPSAVADGLVAAGLLRVEGTDRHGDPLWVVPALFDAVIGPFRETGLVTPAALAGERDARQAGRTGLTATPQPSDQPL